MNNAKIATELVKLAKSLVGAVRNVELSGEDKKFVKDVMMQLSSLQKQVEHYRPTTLEGIDAPGGMKDVLSKVQTHLNHARSILHNELL